MDRRALAACLLASLGAIACADESPFATLKTPEIPTPSQPLSDPFGSLFPTEIASDVHPLSSFPGGEPGLIFDGSLNYIFSNLRGSRVAAPQFQPVANWRVPQLNVADLDGISGRGSSPASYFAGARLAAGYRLDGGWGEFIAAAHWAGGAREQWFSNGDPRTAWFVQSQLADQTQNDESGRDGPIGPQVEPGRLDPIGVSHIHTRVGVSTYDLTYGNGIYGTTPLELRLVVGVRWGNLLVEDVNDGIGAMAQERTSFAGFGPMASLYGEWKVLGDGPFDQASLGLFGQLTGSLLFGRTDQIEREEFDFPNPFSRRYAESANQQSVPVFGFSAGVVGRIAGSGPAFMLGYDFEEWKHVGKVGASNFDLTMHSIFIRCTWNY